MEDGWPGVGEQGEKGHQEARPRMQREARQGGQAHQSRWQRPKADMFEEGAGQDSEWVPT